MDLVSEYYHPVQDILRLQEIFGLRFGDAKNFKNWVYMPDSEAYEITMEKTGKKLFVSYEEVPPDIRNASSFYKELMFLTTYSKVNKIIRRSGIPAVRSVNGQFTITHLFRYIYCYREKVKGKTNLRIANGMGITTSTLNHYLAREFIFLF